MSRPDAVLDEQGNGNRLKGPTENLFLDALTLDPLSGMEVPPPSRLDSEKRFPLMTRWEGAVCSEPSPFAP